MRLHHRIVAAIDATEVGRARSVAKALAGHVDALKVNWPLVLAAGPEILKEFAASSYVLGDFKIADIPNTNRLIVEQAIAHGASGIICHAFAGEDSVRACVDAAQGAEVFVVTELSHPGGQEFTAKHAEEFARLAVRAGAAGLIAPATRPARARRRPAAGAGPAGGPAQRPSGPRGRGPPAAGAPARPGRPRLERPERP